MKTNLAKCHCFTDSLALILSLYMYILKHFSGELSTQYLNRGREGHAQEGPRSGRALK